MAFLSSFQRLLIRTDSSIYPCKSGSIDGLKFSYTVSLGPLEINPFLKLFDIMGKTRSIVPIAKEKTDLVSCVCPKYKTHPRPWGQSGSSFPYQACQRVDAVTHIGRLAVKKITAKNWKGPAQRSVTKGVLPKSTSGRL